MSAHMTRPRRSIETMVAVHYQGASRGPENGFVGREIISLGFCSRPQQRWLSRHAGRWSKLDPAPGFSRAPGAAMGGFVQRLFRFRAFQGNSDHQDQAIRTRHQANGSVDVAARLASVSDQLRQRHVVLQQNQG